MFFDIPNYNKFLVTLQVNNYLLIDTIKSKEELNKDSIIDAKLHKEELWVDSIINSMSTNEKIGQLFMIDVFSNKNHDYYKNIKKTILQYNIGGVIFFQGSAAQEWTITKDLQKCVKYPLLVGIDAEHGVGWRLKDVMTFPRMQTLGAIQDDSLTYKLGAAIAKDCQFLGIHINFSPDADINNNPLNPIIGIRSFGDNRENVAQKALMYIRGSLSENVLPVAKHFPGHGNTSTDSHKNLPLIRGNKHELDSVELYPFAKLIASRIPAIMVGHLNIPALDSSGLPASLSPKIIKGLLKNELGFKGIIISDAMNMKGVVDGRLPGEAEVLALKAGVDILLFPKDIKAAINAINNALKSGLLDSSYLDQKCRSILRLKYKYVLNDIFHKQNPIIPTKDNILVRLNTKKDSSLRNKIIANSLTLVKNDSCLIPLTITKNKKIAILYYGDYQPTFQNYINKFCKSKVFILDDNSSDNSIIKQEDLLSYYDYTIIYNSVAQNSVNSNFGYSLKLKDLILKIKCNNIIMCYPKSPYGLLGYCNLPIKSLIVGYSNLKETQQLMAQSIFGAIPLKGKLPVSIDLDYPYGTGMSSPQIRLGYSQPEFVEIDSDTLNKIDSICERAIELKATPGCQVLVAKDGYIIYNKAFGYHTYKKHIKNTKNDIYDLASITKVMATLPAFMKLYEYQKVKLNDTLSLYNSKLSGNNKSKLTFYDVLCHNSGLQSYIPFMSEAIDSNSILHGNLFTHRSDKYHRRKIEDGTYMYTNYKFNDSTFSNKDRKAYLKLSKNFYMFPSYRDSILVHIINSKLDSPAIYKYSDLGFILLKESIDSISQKNIYNFCYDSIYSRIGINNIYNSSTLINSIQKYDSASSTTRKSNKLINPNRIIPSTYDKIYKRGLVWGEINDPTAFLLSGIAGNAGLFSDARSLAIMGQMFLNNGIYLKDTLFKQNTISLFTTRNTKFPENRRALGFDKPETNIEKDSPVCKEASPSSFGHSGFTGTLFWCDPKYNLKYIFLSNRTYPNEYDNKLVKENIRSDIHSIIYRSIK